MLIFSTRPEQQITHKSFMESMKNILVTATVGVMMLAPVVAFADNDERESERNGFNSHGYGNDKVTICHKGHTETVNQNAVRAHLAHGDKLGACTNGGGSNGSGNPRDKLEERRREILAEIQQILGRLSSLFGKLAKK